MKSPVNQVAVLLLTASTAIPMFAQSDGASIYKAKCAMCYGATGLADTPAGKALKAASYKDPAIIKASDDELIAAVKNGKGKMPPNNGRLTDAQIQAAIAYVRTLQK